MLTIKPLEVGRGHPHILVDDTFHFLDAASLTDGITQAVGPIDCGGCGEDLVDGPCRRGAVECYFCGRRYPILTTTGSGVA